MYTQLAIVLLYMYIHVSGVLMLLYVGSVSYSVYYNVYVIKFCTLGPEK